MHVCILGAGGLGSLIGGKLAESGVDVTLVARPAHAAAIRSDGLRIVGASGDRVVREHLLAVEHPTQVDGDIDHAMLLVKTKDTAAMLGESAGLVARFRTICSLQNSVTKDATLRAWAGDRTIGASTTEAATLVGPGVVRHTGTAPVAFYFGELDGTPSERVAELVASCSNAGLGAAESADIAHVEWEKLMQISLVAAFSVSLLGFAPGANVADGMRLRPGAEHYVALARELLAVYQAMGYEPRDYFAPYARFTALRARDDETAVRDVMSLGEQMHAAGVRGLPSLHDDLLRGRTTEVDDCVGRFVAEAERLGVATPTVRAAWRTIRALEQFPSAVDRVPVA
jgi:2-dehydropantoate 2-reductase